jgi:hypothetical protein
VRYPFDDHNPCPFEMLDRFCADVHHYLSKHPQNIAAVHCKVIRSTSRSVRSFVRRLLRAGDAVCAECSGRPARDAPG